MPSAKIAPFWKCLEQIREVDRIDTIFMITSAFNVQKAFRPEVHIPRIRGKKIRAPHAFRFGELYAIGRIGTHFIFEICLQITISNSRYLFYTSNLGYHQHIYLSA